jgi:hypothetical protein
MKSGSRPGLIWYLKIAMTAMCGCFKTPARPGRA